MVEAPELTISARIALDAIRRYDPKAEDINFYDEVRDFGGGTMMLAEVYYPPQKPGDEKGRSEYFVMVRNGRGAVFHDYAMALREGSRPAEFISKVASPDVVTAILTFVLVFAFIAAAFNTIPRGEETKALGTALTTVLGFWFGRQSR